jgi:hypothetical protein
VRCVLLTVGAFFFWIVNHQCTARFDSITNYLMHQSVSRKRVAIIEPNFWKIYVSDPFDSCSFYLVLTLFQFTIPIFSSATRTSNRNVDFRVCQYAPSVRCLLKHHSIENFVGTSPPVAIRRMSVESPTCNVWKLSEECLVHNLVVFLSVHKANAWFEARPLLAPFKVDHYMVKSM